MSHTNYNDQSSPVVWFGILSRNDGIPKHCARCHKDYTIVHTGGTPHCSIPHVFNTNPVEHITNRAGLLPGQTLLRYNSECCGPSVCIFELEGGSGSGDSESEIWQEGEAFCFLGDHTTFEEEAQEHYNGVNILLCLKKKRNGLCYREWLRGLAGEENENVVWSGDYNRQKSR